MSDARLEITQQTKVDGYVEALRWAAKEVHRKRAWCKDSPELADLEDLFTTTAEEATT